MNKNIYEVETYINELKKVGSDPIFESFRNKTILMTGGTGLILSYFVDAILETNINCILFLIVRDYKLAFSRFSKHVGDPRLHFIEKSLSNFEGLENMEVDYIISGASRTNPISIKTSPSELFLENINGVKNCVKIALNFSKSKLLLLSTTKVYGQNKDILDENVTSIINPNTCDDILGFSKLASEKLVLSYIKEEGLNASIARLSRTFGPTLKFDDSKDLSTYLFESLLNKTIFLKTRGDEVIPFSYVGNVVLALTYILVKGENGEAYNLLPEKTYKMKELVNKIASFDKKEVILSEDVKEISSQFDNIKISNKLLKLGFKPQFDVLEGLETTYKVLKEIF